MSSENLPSRMQSVHESLAELRRIAKEAKSRDDPRLRKATEAEIQLATTLLPPHACGRPSLRTGLPCVRPKGAGAPCCRVHGGALPSTRRAAERRLREASLQVVNAMIENATQTENRPAAVKAGSVILDKAGVGADIRAKIRSSQGSESGRITVNIGFLSQPNGEPTTITVPLKPEGERA